MWHATIHLLFVCYYVPKKICSTTHTRGRKAWRWQLRVINQLFYLSQICIIFAPRYWYMEQLLEYGYIGLFVGSFLAATVFPFSSDVLLVGMLIAGAGVVPTVVVATIGNWLGGLTSYWLGWLGKMEWIERWFKVKRETLERYQRSVERWGAWLALLTWLPFVGDVFAIVLGFFKVKFLPAAFWMLVGKGARFVVWAIIYNYASHLL